MYKSKEVTFQHDKFGLSGDLSDFYSYLLGRYLHIRQY